MLLSGNWLIGCVILGASLGTSMIVLYSGPGIILRAKTDSREQRYVSPLSELNTIAAALEQYKKDHGSLPVKLSAGSTEICTTIGADCATGHKLDLGFLVNAGQGQQYLQVVPRDPSGNNKEWSTDYFLAQLPDGTF